MVSELSSYLKQLTFDPQLSKGIVPALVTNIRVTILLVLVIIISGIFALINLPRRINPEVNIPIVFISTFLPGAGPQDVERLVTVPLEDALQSVEGIDTFSSNSVDNLSTIVLQFQSSVDINTATADVQEAVDGVIDLPEDANEPNVQALDFEDIPVISFAIVTQADPASLAQFSRQMQQRIEDVPTISNVVVSGAEESEIEIYIPAEKYQQYGISPLQLQGAITAALRTYPAGTVSTTNSTLSFSIDLTKTTLEKLRTLPIKVGDVSYALGDVAEISVKSIENQARSYIATQDQPANRTVSFSVYKTTGSDLEKAASAAKDAAQEVIEQHEGRFEMIVTTDFEKEIQDQFIGLVEDFSTSILLVFITLLLFLGFRQALLASFVIPLSFFATFAAMYWFDIQLSFLSLFSLLLGLGMIVDDTIVIISAMTDYYKTHKFTPEQTGLLVWNDYLIPTLTSNLTNVWSFLPLLIAAGIIGEFTKVISIVVTIALVGSTAIALVVTIPFMMVVLKPEIPGRVKTLGLVIGLLATVGAIIAFLQFSPVMPVIVIAAILFFVVTFIIRKQLVASVRSQAKSHKSLPAAKKVLDRLNTGFISTERYLGRYKSVLRRILESKTGRRNTIAAVIILSVFSYMLVPLGLVKNVFFPEAPVDYFNMSLELPEATKLEITEAETIRLANELRQTEGIEYVIADIGRGTDQSSISIGQIETNIVSFTLNLVPEEERTKDSIELAQEVREKYADYATGDLQVVELSGGPPAGADLQITLLGDDLATLEDLGEKTKSYLRTKEGVANPTVSVPPGTSKLLFEPDLTKLQDTGISLDQVGLVSRLFTSGFTIDQARLDQPECEDECAIVLRTQRGSLSADNLSSITVPDSANNLVPLSALGQLKLTQNPTIISRLDGKRSITITADVLVGYNTVELGQELQAFVDGDLNMPEGYTTQTGGVNQENQESVTSILQAMVIALILIMGTMVVQLQSFRKSLIVMMVIPLAITGVFIIFAVLGIPLSFAALIGVLALFGIVVKNSIMIVDKINLNLKAGLPFTEAVTDGATSRLEPIFFSSVTNIIGLIPITISDPFWRGLGGAIIAGLSMSGIIMLFFIPVVYYVWFVDEYRKQATTV
ncbi:MAG: hypothetical protein QG639_80 [Patescibacteria group bacterium]|nr:hypothetical protein [Patescibacteria group bacterium]